MTEERPDGIDLSFDLAEPPQKVWRAISIPEFRRHWLPDEVLTDAEATSQTPGEEIRYRMRDSAPPFLDSIVTFRIAPNGTGGTRLRIIHELTDARFLRATTVAANNNGAPVMRAA